MRKAMRILCVWMVATAGMLTACGPVEESPELQAETEAPERTSRQALEAPAGKKDSPDVGTNSCFTTTCRPGAQGDAYCTSLCGDVARCFSSGYGCGSRPCCVLM